MEQPPTDRLPCSLTPLSENIMGKLAINGGTPAVDRLKTQWPIYGDEEKKALLEVLDSGRWCSAGNSDGKVAQAMTAFGKFIGTKHAMACTSGTTALETALRACCVGHGDEVIVPAVTFLASASAIACTGATPVFADIDPETYQISGDSAESLITERTKAIMPVHYGGYPADMDRIPALAAKYGLAVVEDCAEAHGTEWRGKKVGSLGTVGAFSFQMGKPLTAGEGGAITYDDDALAISHYQYSRTVKKPDGSEETVHYASGNWRMSEFVGAILGAQLTRIEEQTEIRHRNGEVFADELDKIGGISALKRDSRITKKGYYFWLMRYDAAQWDGIPRNRFMEALRAEGVGTGTAHNDPVYWYPAFRQDGKGGNPKIVRPEAERVYREVVVAMGKDILIHRENVDKIVGAIGKLRENLSELRG